MRQSRTRRRRYVREAMSLEELETWIDQLDPPPLIDGVSMRDGYLTATIIGPCFIDPHKWLHHILGPHSGLGMEGTEQAAAIMAIVTRSNAISEGLATAPERYAPIFERTDDGAVLAGPWCMGFFAAMKLHRDAWRPLRDLSRIEHRLLLPILIHCTDAAGHPLFGQCGPVLKVKSSCAPPITIFPSWSRRSASFGCRSVPEAGQRDPTSSRGMLTAHTKARAGADHLLPGSRLFPPGALAGGLLGVGNKAVRLVASGATRWWSPHEAAPPNPVRLRLRALFV